MNRHVRIPLVAVLLLAACTLLRGQNASPDSVFRLVQAQRAEQYEKYGLHYRLVEGHARFLHNNTYLLCDSASWNVDARFIEAYGNVQIIQDKTMLRSDQMSYWIDENRAVFKGSLVELFDKDGNILRTERLVYNTKDSVAVFEGGGSMKDRDGNVIESTNGTYDGKESLFTFENRVEIYLDSIELKTQTLRYFSQEEKAYFGRNTFAWKNDGFLRADAGWYDRPQQLVQFSDHVFMFDPVYEAWAGEVYYRQQDSGTDLYDNAQVLDTTHKCVYLGDHLQYIPPQDSLSERGLMTGDPAIVFFGENENHVVDTLYSRADTFYVYAVPRCDIPESEIKEAEKRVEDILFDALTQKRETEAKLHEEERIKKMREVGKLPPEWVEQQKKAEADSLAKLARLDSLVTVGVVDSLVAADPAFRGQLSSVDSLINVKLAPPAAASDTTAVVRDTTAATLPLRDTTPVRYVQAWHNVKMFRSDIQAVCDSVVFTEVDSIARLFGTPALWNEVKNQLTADEMHLLMRNGAFERGSMLTNAWIISQQDTVHYNQIKSTEMLGYFRDNKLYRFDALGGVSAIFYMADEDVITTINLKEAKSMTAALKDGTATRLLYTDAIKSDLYPVGDLPAEKQRLKDFKWRGDERPRHPWDITRRKLNPSEKANYEGMKKPLYRETNKYFDNYMIELFEKIDAEKRAEYERRQAEQDSLLRVAALQAEADSIAALQALDLPEPADREVIPADSLAAAPVVMTVPAATLDTTRVAAVKPDSTAVAPVAPVAVVPSSVEKIEKPVAPAEVTPASPETVIQSDQLTRAEKRALRRAERKARREARRAERLARRLARKNQSL
ncbi:MAG: hypothetical protein II048_01380 [Bacteroidales bacterium]|nr:hypothetical protein [Bacteroidales bacterium]MBQ2193745.1 hypothetical protein [Bacteroidales bacterium]